MSLAVCAICVLLSVTIFHFFWRWLRRSLRRSLSGEVVVVTGCDSGLGWAITQRLIVQEHAVVVACCFTPTGLERCQKLGKNAVPIQVDVTKDEDVSRLQSAVQSALTQRGAKMLGLVNNAGIGNYGFAEALDLERFRAVLEVNCLGTVRVTKAFLPMLRERGVGARLVTIGSLSDRLPAGFGSAYVPTKAYVCWFTESVAAEVRRFGVRTAVVEPGFIATELLDSAQTGGAAASEAAPAEVRRAYGDFLPMMNELRRSVMLCEKLNGGKEGGGAWVADATIDALSSSWPRSRYLVGFETKVLTWLPHLPGWTRLVAFAFEQQHRSVFK